MVYDVVIIGGGASGLQAGIQALKKGYKKTLILERESYLGGNLNLFIHNGFNGVTGPELSSALIKEYKQLGGEYKTNSSVLKLTKNKEITYISPNDKIATISSEKIVIASGIRERFTGNIIIPTHRYSGIFTIAAAHKIINFKGYLPGKEVVIVGRNRWSLILARRFYIEGAKVKAVLIDDYQGAKITDDDLKIIDGFNIPIIKNSIIDELSGSDRIEEVTILNLSTQKEEAISCDSLVISVGYYPETKYLDESIKISSDYKTNIDGIYVCGTARLGEDGLEVSYKEEVF